MVAPILFAVAVGGTIAACASPPRPAAVVTSTLTLPCAATTITARGRVDEVDAVAAVIPVTCTAIAARGLAPTAPIRLTIHGDVDAFVAATGQTVDTLRAWSTPDAVHLLTLASWQRRDDDAVSRRLTHELCHVALFQRLGERARRVPRALGEGLCSVVAGQGDERLPLAVVRDRIAAGDAVDFIDDSPFAYGVAHHVVEGIARCRGDTALLPIVDAVANGEGLVEVLGAPPRSFLGGCPAVPGGTDGTDAVESRR